MSRRPDHSPARPQQRLRRGGHVRRAAAQVGRWLAIYLVVLQAVFAGLAAGAMAGPQTVSDPFLLCLTSHQADAQADAGGSSLPPQHDCTACPLAGGMPVLPDLKLPSVPVAFARPGEDRIVQPAPARTAQICPNARPRAPPTSA
ncbi:DUF2946 family protein [Azorhizobium oxalatiphilum]|uniref:DUF2946 family protein n=1 Tax=Azorhizobium oxalatiphilum TaxID=980631 RepID=UPI00166D836D|nr:DUF2946 family protein [Azorhizobium oxalatiphilum]